MKHTIIYNLLMFFFLMNGSMVYGQKAERKNIREGNKQYKKENYTDAEISFRKSQAINPNSLEGAYNLGNVLYKSGDRYDEAFNEYKKIAEQAPRLLNDDINNAGKLAEVYHNMGNVCMKKQDYAQSVDMYKQSLRLNPSDDETRYNLALAQKLLEEQQGDNDGDGDNDNEDQDQEQDQEDNQDNQQDQQQDQNQQDENKEQEQPQSDEQMSRENAQQLLDAFLQDEKDTQEKVQRAQQEQQQRRRTDKEW